MPWRFGNKRKLFGCIGSFKPVTKPKFCPADIAYVLIAFEAFRIVDF